jgi:hypothetical protein
MSSQPERIWQATLRRATMQYVTEGMKVCSAVAAALQKDAMLTILIDIEKHLAGGSALHAGSLIFAEDAPALNVIRRAIKAAA